MANPLSGSAANNNSFFTGLAHMREWCEEKNERAERNGWKHWLYVDDAKRDDGSTHFAIAELDGSFAAEVWHARDGMPLVPMGWDEKRIRGLHKSLLFKLERGLSEEGWSEWRRRIAA